MTWASLALAAFVAETEAGTIIQEATPTGQYSLGAVYGPGQVFTRTIPATLAAWTQASRQFGGLWWWLAVQAGFGILVIAGYVGLGLAFRRPGGGGERQPGALPRLAASWRLRQWLPLYLLALVNLAQDGIAITAAVTWIRRHEYVPAGVASALEGAVIAKWVMAVVFAGWLAYRVLVSSESGRRARRIGSALKKQRFSVVIVALLAVMAIARGTDVLDQLPDVQRAWLTWPPSMGWAHLAFAVLAQALLAVLLVLLSAMRVQRARAARLPADRRDVHSYLPWVLTSLVIPGLAVALWLSGGAAVAWRRVIAIPLVLCGVAAISVAIQFAELRRGRAPGGAAGVGAGAPDGTGPDAATASVGRDTGGRNDSDGADGGSADHAGGGDDAVGGDDAGGAGPGRGEAEAVAAARTAGDMLAVAVIAVTGLGLVGSFTAAALVAGRPYGWAFAAAVVAGFAVAVLPWLAARGWLQDLAAYFDRRYHSTGWQRTRQGLSPRRTGPADERRSPALLLAVFATPFVIADLLLIFVPLPATHWLGVLATMVIALGTLAAGLAVLAYLVQSRRPLPVFALLRLRATPVFTLILIIGLVGGALDTSSRLHDIRLPAAVSRAAAGGRVAAPARGQPAMLGSLSQWLADPATRACARPVPAAPGAAAGGVRVEPLILVAAAGGGIRAAWWTVHALSALAATGCGRHEVFAASGVSGGSIGLAVLGTTAARDAAVARLAGPDALAAAIDGLLLRDTIAGLAGLDLTAAGMPAGQRYPDRAALLERAWETEDPALAEPFPLRRPVLPWRLMFNSTAAGTGCRAVIADRRIAPASVPPAASSPGCGLSSNAPLPDSYDFFAEYPCLAGLGTVTAALLSARFPYVTPSGVVNGCGRLAGTQLEQYVDGGYADSSGLATLAGLAPELMPVIRQYNAGAVASARPGQPVTLVLPVVVYLRNRPQPEPVTGTAARSASQPLIPLASGAASASSQLTSSAALLQELAGDISAAPSPSCGQGGAGCAPHEQWLACATADSRCAAAQAAAAGAVPQQLIVVTPREFPAVTAPLGWVLSPASRLALDRELAAEAAGRCQHPSQNQEFCPAGVGRLGDLLRIADGR